MKTTLNKKNNEVTIRMSLNEYDAVREAMATISGNGVGTESIESVFNEKGEKVKGIYRVTGLYYKEEMNIYTNNNWPEKF